MNFQIDIKPVFIGEHMKPHFIMVSYINDYCYQSTINKDEVELLIDNGIVHKVQRCIQNEDGSLTFIDYPKGVDDTGVMYTSKLFELKEATVN